MSVKRLITTDGINPRNTIPYFPTMDFRGSRSDPINPGAVIALPPSDGFVPTDNYQPFGVTLAEERKDNKRKDNSRWRFITFVAGTGGLALIGSGCSTGNTAPVSAPTSVVQEQAQASAEAQPYSPENQAILDGLVGKVQESLSKNTPEQIEFATKAYAGPDSLAPTLISNTNELNEISFYKGKPDNWQATLIAKLNSGNISIIQAEIDKLSITPKALESYLQQCNKAIEESLQENNGQPDFNSLTADDSLKGNWWSAQTMHAVAWQNTIKNLLELAQQGQITFPEQSTLTDNGTAFEKVNVINDGEVEASPLIIEVDSMGNILVGGEPTKNSKEIHWANSNSVTPYSITGYNAVDGVGALYLFAELKLE